MSEVTAVPLRPIKPGAVTRLWLGIGAALIAAAGLAWAGTAGQAAAAGTCKASYFEGKGRVERLASGLAIQTIKPGAGPRPAATDYVLINYKGMLPDKTVFDQAERAPLELPGVVPGFRDGVVRMQNGGKYRICIPPALGYGAQSTGPIPANSTLLFDIDLLEFKTAAEVQALQMRMQQMQMQMQGAPQAAPHP